MSQELATIDSGEVVVVPTLAESEAKIKGIVRRVKRAQDTAVASMESARTETERSELEIGEELNTIKASKSFRDAGFKSWGAYLAVASDRIGISDRHAQRHMRAAKTDTNDFVSEIQPTNERQVVEISRVPEDRREVVLEQTIEVAGKLTARGIRETAERITNPQPPDDAPDGALLVAVASACSAALADGWTPGEIWQVVLDAIGDVTA